MIGQMYFPGCILNRHAATKQNRGKEESGDDQTIYDIWLYNEKINKTCNTKIQGLFKVFKCHFQSFLFGLLAWVFQYLF